jgi:hypothetical protein
MGLSGAVVADSIDINVNSDSIQAVYGTDWRTAEFNLGLSRNSDKDSWVASAGLLATDQKQNRGARTEVGLGGKIYAVSVGNQDVQALGLGGEVRVFPNDGPIGIGGYGFYAPNVVTTGDGKNFWEAGARVEFEVIKNSANVYLGYSKVRTELNGGAHLTVDSGGHVGMRIEF